MEKQRASPQASACIVSLGCPKNQVDSEVLAAGLKREGFSFVPDPEGADVIVLNTCSFIEPAVRESLEVLESLLAYRRSGSCRCLVLAGCLVQRYGRNLLARFPDVDLFLGTDAIPDAGRILLRQLALPGRRLLIARPLGGEAEQACGSRPAREALGPWAYVKIAEGCSNRCFYCTIPKIRGPLKSRAPGEILEEVNGLVRQGVGEINLVAQDLTSYGLDWHPRGPGSLAELLGRLERIRGLRWIRLLYCHPAHLDEATIELMAESDKICPYLDLPIQHASTRILRAMGRPYDERTLRALIDRLRRRRPDIVLRTTILVGFPGETDEDVERLLAFLREVRFHHLGAFTYSPERGTRAWRRTKGRVPEEEKQRRLQAVLALQADISRELLARYVGTDQEILVEGRHEEDPRYLRARTRYQAPEVDGCVLVPPGPEVGPGFARARIIRAHTYDLEAEIRPV